MIDFSQGSLAGGVPDRPQTVPDADLDDELPPRPDSFVSALAAGRAPDSTGEGGNQGSGGGGRDVRHAPFGLRRAPFVL